MSANNLGLIELATQITINEASKPAKLPGLNDKPTGELIISGWGAYKTIAEHNKHIYPDSLLAANVTIANDLEGIIFAQLLIKNSLYYFFAECCNEFNNISSWPLTSDSEKYLCTRPNSSEETTTICSGDTGGPLANNGVIYGVALFGFNHCDIPGSPGIFIKISDHLDWIKKYVNNI